MLKSKKGKKGVDDAEEYPPLSTAQDIEDEGKRKGKNADATPELLITSKAEKKSRKRSKSVSGKLSF